MPHEVHTYTELTQQIHDDLRTQHPEWIEPTGECPECDEHEARLKELLETLPETESNAEAGPAIVGKRSNTQVRHEVS